MKIYMPLIFYDYQLLLFFFLFGLVAISARLKSEKRTNENACCTGYRTSYSMHVFGLPEKLSFKLAFQLSLQTSLSFQKDIILSISQE